MAQIDGAGQQDADNQNAEALQAALAQREVTLQGQPQGGSDVPSHQNSDPVVRRIGNSTVPSASYRKTSCTVCTVNRPVAGRHNRLRLKVKAPPEETSVRGLAPLWL